MIHIEEREKGIENRKDMLGWLLFTPYGRGTMFVVAAFILSFCAPRPASVPTASEPAPTFTFTAEPPTAIPPTATEVASPTPEKKEYPPTNVTFDAEVTLDMDNVIKTNDKLPGGTELRRVVLVKLTTGQIIAVNMQVENFAEGSAFYTPGVRSQTFVAPNMSMPDGEGESSANGIPWGLDGMLYKLLKANGLNGKTVKVRLTTGNDSSSLLHPDYNPIDETLAGDLGDIMVEFGNTLDTTILPTYPDITVNGQPVPVAIIYKMEVIPEEPSQP